MYMAEKKSPAISISFPQNRGTMDLKKIENLELLKIELNFGTPHEKTWTF
jgi:hypothetical protein